MVDEKKEYDFSEIESQWQKKWEKDGIYQAVDFDSRPKKYVLVEFPYPSGDGLHVGHCLSYIAQDVIARQARMQGNNVLYPMGWDAFGLPTENYAIKTKTKPQDVAAKNIANFKRQIQALGISFDWSREVNTTDPNYYKWTQWIFLQMFKHGLAEKKEVPINWCPKDKIGLAFEEVIDGACERCGTAVERRSIKQWVLKITQYADRLIDDLETVDFLPEVKRAQINWIGRSEGALIIFKVPDSELAVEVFTTRLDTIFSGTFLILAPEHKRIHDLKPRIRNWEEVERYIQGAGRKSDRERQENQEKAGVELKGVVAVNPATGDEMPVWISDFVLAGYGTGAVFADAHDQRDFDMAKKYGIPLKVSLKPEDGELWKKVQRMEVCYEGEGTLVNSGEFDGLSSAEARKKILKWLSEKGAASKTVQYKLRDWIFSRQHYWGEPIPIIHCEACGEVPMDETDLPLILPEVEFYEPTDTGESPLAKIDSWVNTTCPKCGGSAKRETDTMPNWAGSSWYFLRYSDSRNNTALADIKKLEYWLPVDLYNGGSEHTTLHLLYSRFWHKFLYDIKTVPTPEPYQRRVQHGVILAPDGQKMSKSRGNVINPDDIVAKYGADVFRLYMLFMGEYDQIKSWSDEHIRGVYRFMKGMRNHLVHVGFQENNENYLEQGVALNQAIIGITADLERRSFNTAVSKLMICWNAMENLKMSRGNLEIWAKLLAPFVPHFAEYIWRDVLGRDNSIHIQEWPTPNNDDKIFLRQKIKVGVQINGKVRTDITVTETMNGDDVRAVVMALPEVQKYIEGKTVKKFIYIPKRIVSIVV